jgi:hypothetical protein
VLSVEDRPTGPTFYDVSPRAPAFKSFDEDFDDNCQRDCTLLRAGCASSESPVEIRVKAGYDGLAMPQFRRLPISHWLAAAVLVALAQWLVAPSAEAGCGDYVMIGGHAAQHRHPASNHDRSDDSASLVEAAGAPVHHHRCSRPQCSQGEPRPLAPPPAPVKIVTTDWGILAAPFAPASLELRFARFEDDTVRPLPGASTIYRPPR